MALGKGWRREGDPEAQARAAARAEAERKGTVPDFERAEAARKAADQKKSTEDLRGREERRKIQREGELFAPYMADAARTKIMTGDTRPTKEIAKELMEKAENNERAA